MSTLHNYQVAMSERVHARTCVEAPDEATAEELATAKWHADCSAAVSQCDGPTEVLEFDGPDFVEVEVDPPAEDEPGGPSEGAVETETMKSYRVDVAMVVSGATVVTANDEDEAEELACEKWRDDCCAELKAIQAPSEFLGWESGVPCGATVEVAPTPHEYDFTIAFSLGSVQADGNDVPAASLRAALLARVNGLSDDELKEAVGPPVESYHGCSSATEREGQS